MNKIIQAIIRWLKKLFGIPVPTSVILLINGKATTSMTVMSVGHKAVYTYSVLDQNGNPMTVKPDAVPAWSDTTPTVDTIAPSADGSSMVATAVAPGNDVISMSASFGGVALTGTDPLEVDPAPQVPTSIVLTAVVS